MRIGRMIKFYRMVGLQGIREQSREIGISTATLSRLENGKSVDGKTMIKIIKWAFNTK